MRWCYWKYALGWSALLLFYSTNVFRSEQTGSVFASTVEFFYDGLDADQMYRFHLGIRKFMHVFNYGVLSFLTLFGFTRSLKPVQNWKPHIGVMAIVFCILIALLDETHQSFAEFRAGSVRDVWIDISGAFVVQLWVGYLSWRRVSV